MMFKDFYKRYQPVLSEPMTKIVAVTGLLILIAWILELVDFPILWVSPVIATVAAMIGGWPIAKWAWWGVKEHEINADQLVVIALVASILGGEYIAGAVVAFIMIFGGLLEELTTHKMRLSISDLLDLTPPKVTRRKDGGDEVVGLSEISTEDIVLVRPGERIPVDGKIQSGNGVINEAPITGESVPVDKSVDDEVFAGTLLDTGALTIETTKVGDDTVLGRIVKLVEEAEGNEAPVQRLADKYAKYFTPLIIFIAIAVWIISGDYHRALTIVIVACPCGFVLATPTAVMAGMANGARRGILVKGGKYLEALGKAQVVAFDKTGTLTYGKPELAEIILLNGLNEDKFMRLAATAEKLSEHPLGRTVYNEAVRRGLDTPDPDFFQVHVGKGVCARVDGRHITVGNPEFLEEHNVPPITESETHYQNLGKLGQTVLSVAVDGVMSGLIAVADRPRDKAQAAVQAIKDQGVERVVMLTGDNARVADSIANQVGIDQAYAGQLPEDKLNKVLSFVDSGKTTVMIGDGINDAPALASATVGIAMGAAGTDVAIATADVALMADDLNKVAEAMALSKLVLKTIQQNIIWFAILFNFVGVALASMGNINPIGGAIMHNIGSIAVVLNSSRLIFRKNIMKNSTDKNNST
jgi:Cd2+/Zn2+-exporting ATPase